MPSIQTAVKLNDQMSAAFQHITNAIDMTLSAWSSLDSATSSGLEADGVEEIRNELNKATQAVDQMGNEQDEFNRKVNQGQDAVSGLTSKIAGMVASIGFAKLAGDAIEFASDLTEVQNVVDVTFRDSSAVVDEWAKTTLESYGLNELSAKQYAGTMGAMLKSSGLTGNAVTDMSMRITELAGDMASFYNLESEEAFTKIRSGISGETEPLKQLGINMSVANLEAYAMSQGITKAYDEMSQAEQVTLRYNYLLQATSDAQGDFARTSDSFANQQKLLKENFTEFTGELASYVLPVIAQLFHTANNGLQFLSENIEVVMPLLGGLLTIIGLYVGALAVYNGIKAITAAVEAVHAAKLMLSTGATFAATAAQYGFNAALLACPITWIIILVVALIAVIIALANWLKTLGGTATTAFGVIAGGFAVLGAFIWNEVVGVTNAVIQFLWSGFVEPWIGIIEWVLNVFNGGFNSFGDAVKNLLGNIISWFLSLGEVVTKIIDAIFGTDWTSGLESLKSSVLEWGKNENAITLDRTAPEVLQRISYMDAYDAGAKWGDGISDKVSDKLSEMFSIDDALGDFSVDTDAYGLDGLTQDVDDIAANTGSMADSLDITSEDLKYLRDLAEQDAVNRFTTAEVKVDLGGVTNNLSSNMDLDGVVDYLTTGVQEAMERIAEGVH